MRVRIENIECRRTFDQAEGIEFEFVQWIGESEMAQYPHTLGWLAVDMEAGTTAFVSSGGELLKLDEKQQLLFFRVYKLSNELFWEKQYSNAN